MQGYAIAPGGGTLVEGIAWLWETLRVERPPELFNGRSVGSRSVVWAELFVEEFPGHPAGRSMDARFAGDGLSRFGYTSGGGATSCMYRRVSRLEPASEVLEVLRALMRHCDGLPAGFADGRFGPGARAALRRFQKSHGLAPGGIPGSRTSAALAASATGACR